MYIAFSSKTLQLRLSVLICGLNWQNTIHFFFALLKRRYKYFVETYRKTQLASEADFAVLKY